MSHVICSLTCRLSGVSNHPNIHVLVNFRFFCEQVKEPSNQTQVSLAHELKVIFNQRTLNGVSYSNPDAEKRQENILEWPWMTRYKIQVIIPATPSPDVPSPEHKDNLASGTQY